jgi:hypothetical protein
MEPQVQATRLIEILDRWAAGAAVVLAFALVLLYFLLPDSIGKERKDFLADLITNFIPVLVVFAASYLLFGEVQKIRHAEQQRDLVAKVSNSATAALGEQFDLITQKVDATTRLVRDWDEKGVERVCTEAEIGAISAIELQRTSSLKVIGIGHGWLLKGEKYLALETLLSRQATVQLLIPDPFSSQIRERYDKDEGEGHELDIPELAGLVLKWKTEMGKHPSLSVRLYDRYPMMNVSVYTNRVFASPLLYKRRGKDGLTFVFRRPSIGADIYEGHFDKVFDSDSTKSISEDYILKYT